MLTIRTIVCVASLLSAAVTATETTTLRNEALAFDFAGADEGFALRRIVNRLGGETSFAERTDAKSCLWVAQFWKNGDAGRLKGLNNLMPCRARRLERNPDGGATFVWEGMDLPDDPGAVTVRMTVRFAADGTSRWTLDVQNQSRDWGLAETHYPILPHVAKDGEADFLCPWKDVGARLHRHHRWGGKNVEFNCTEYPPMMAAWMIGEAGCYVAAHDSEVRVKRIRISPECDFRFITPVENAGIPGKAAEGPRYEVTVAAFRGDWWEAAKLYRRWALTTKWTAKGRIADRTDYPTRVCGIPLWFNVHGDARAVSNNLTVIRREFPGMRLGFHWHLWHLSGEHDVGYPEYFPARPGVRECVAYAHSLGIEPMAHTNGRLWTIPLLGFPYVREYAMADERGAHYVERYGKVPPLAAMCPYTEKWSTTLYDFTGRILGLGFRCTFLDQVGAFGSRPCHARTHGHPAGGGTFYFDGYQKLLERAHRNYAKNGAILTTEGSGEEWMNVVDAYLTVTQRSTYEVPFYHAVYNGYTTWFGSHENAGDDDDSFWANQARELVWGQALGWFPLGSPRLFGNEGGRKREMLRRLAKFRQDNLDCLAYGEMTGEVAFAGDMPRQPVSWKACFTWDRQVEGDVPAAIGYRWRSDKGRPCVILANLTSKEIPVALSLSGGRRELTLAPRELKRVDETL